MVAERQQRGGAGSQWWVGGGETKDWRQRLEGGGKGWGGQTSMDVDGDRQE